MIKIKRSIVNQILQVSEREQLYQYLQNAIELEHATLPPYLTAMFSLKPGTNTEIRDLIRSIVIEEMLHMTISANTLIAIGGSPQINTPEFIPKYPGGLPMGIGGPDFEVPIAAFSKDLVKNVFMVIEEPEDPIHIKALAAAVDEYATIGEFYAAVQTKIKDLGDEIFVPGSGSRQVQKWFSQRGLFPITNVDQAVAAIEVIVVEGEGTSTDPFQSPGDPAHYYKFGEIYHGKKIVKTADGYAYAGADIPFDSGGVFPIKANAKNSDYREGTQARVWSERYSYSYSSLLNALHEAFNGDPDNIDTAIGLMYELKVQAAHLMAIELDDGSGQTAGPSYEYTNVQGGMPFSSDPVVW